ncbi:MAG: hypothetical protein UHK60_05115 [Acutalibacteraceae bacterium]|nr:hypothetical protein [Acutalibacteraceae bacterium]
MSLFRKRFVSVLLALSMVGAVSSFTAYADELDDTVTNDDYVADDGNTGEYIPPADPPVVDSPVVDPPADDTGDYGDGTTTDTPDDYIPDDTPDDSYDDTGNQNSGSVDDTDYDDTTDDDYYYENDYYYDDSYYYEPQYSDYNYGMSFNDFERATDYSSAIVDPEAPTVDMYNSNGSDAYTLSSNDWNEIKLNLGGTSSDGTGDFSFIKDNDSDKNSNISILFLIFGIVFVLTSVSLIVYLIASAINSRKLQKSYANRGSSKRRHNSKNTDPYATKRTKFIYDTGEIDITNYNDNF